MYNIEPFFILRKKQSPFNICIAVEGMGYKSIICNLFWAIYFSLFQKSFHTEQRMFRLINSRPDLWQIHSEPLTPSPMAPTNG